MVSGRRGKRERRQAPWRLMAVLGLAAVCCACRRHPVEEPWVARVGDAFIRAEDMRAEAARRLETRHPVPPRRELLDEMVTYDAMLQAARHAGLERDPVVRRRIERVLIESYKERELIPRLDGVVVDERELKADYEADIARYTRPAKVRLAALMLAAERRMSDAKRDELRSRLNEAREAVRAHPPAGGRGSAAGAFGELAITHSDDQASRYRGGDIGWFDREGESPSRWPRELLERGFALETGQVSDVIEGTNAFYVVMKTDERPAVVTPFEQVVASLRRRALTEARDAVSQAFSEKIRESAGVTIDEAALAAVELPELESGSERKRDTEPPAMPGIRD